MTERTQAELAACLEGMKTEDREGAERGAEDWFLESMFEDGLMPRREPNKELVDDAGNLFS